jgi:glycerol-3-phosphate dehydrogenase
MGRAQALKRMTIGKLDVLVIGGRETAAGPRCVTRGLRVGLVEARVAKGL